MLFFNIHGRLYNGFIVPLSERYKLAAMDGDGEGEETGVIDGERDTVLLDPLVECSVGQGGG